ncbi:MAG: undecaprenyldiphospho-muramoylpentapeptide beta-N-acetylglucosaminyltransferase [Thermodesulfobacteriota bacterium]|nr:undecaprenyldiphospho-muramoylpentapeptide beta-N-acetylglucosaminyltransferase [Thermodesulfobacteriota bacterium]
MEKNIRVIIAGGGTGGHVFPAVAIADEFLERPQVRDVLFTGTEKGLEARILPGMGFTLSTINVEGVRGQGITRMITSLLKIPGSIVQSISIIRNFRPDIVLGVGGYASGPVVIAAHFMGIKTAIAEQNVLPGFTNRMLCRFVDKIFLSFPDRKGWFAHGKVVVTGNPVRREFASGVKNLRKGKQRFSILIFGGSQGARAINRAVIESIEYLKDVKDSLVITHQTGDKDMEEVAEAYHHYGVDSKVCSFITDISSAYGLADLLICRAGATSIAEITASGKASVLIPYPFAVGNHQEYNAHMLADAGAAEIILEKDLDGKTLAETITRLARSPETIDRMEQESERLGNLKAAEHIVDVCMDILGQGPGGGD